MNGMGVPPYQSLRLPTPTLRVILAGGGPP